MKKFFSFLRVFFDTKEIVYVDDDVLFSDAINEIKKDHLIAVDTEFIWRNTYFPSLSLIQISNHNKIFIFDLFKTSNPQPNGINSTRKNRYNFIFFLYINFLLYNL